MLSLVWNTQQALENEMPISFDPTGVWFLGGNFMNWKEFKEWDDRQYQLAIDISYEDGGYVRFFYS